VSTADLGGSESRAQALLKEAAVTAGQLRAASLRLAGRALAAAGGDREAARPVLREVLEAIGVIAYEPGVALTPIGRKSHAARKGTAP